MSAAEQEHKIKKIVPKGASNNVRYLHQEYIGSSSISWNGQLSSYLQTLSPFMDDLTGKFGIDLYKKMMKDPTVSSSIEILKLSVTSKPYQLTSAVQDIDNNNFELAQEIKEFIEYCYKNLQAPFASIVEQMLSAIPYGHSLTEKTVIMVEEGRWLGKWKLASLKVKDPNSYQFVTDQFNNLWGVLPNYIINTGLKPGTTPGLGITENTDKHIAGTVIDPDSIINMDKFALVTIKGENNDPRGESKLRPAYNGWWLKMQLWIEYLKFIAQCGTPGLWGTTSENAEPVDKLDAAGNVMVDPETDENLKIEAEAAMLEELIKFSSGTAMVFPFGSMVNKIEVQGNGEIFDKGLYNFDKQIVVGILLQNLATSEGKSGNAQAGTSAQESVLEKLITSIKNLMEETIAKITYQLVLWNYGQEAADELCPIGTFPEAESTDFQALSQGIAALWRYGYMHDSQLDATDKKLGLGKRDNVAQQRDLQRGVQAPGQEKNLQNPDNQSGSNQFPKREIGKVTNSSKFRKRWR